jgi:hypothetical protein
MISGEGARIDHTQGAVDVERTSVGDALPTLTDHDLENVAGPNVLLAALDGRLKLSARQIGRPIRSGSLVEPHVAQVQFRGGALQLSTQLVDSGSGTLVGRMRIVRSRPRISDDQNRFTNLVEDDHAIVKREGHVGDATVVVRSVGQSLRIANNVVARVAHGSAAKPRQARNIAGPIAREQALQILEGIGGLELFRAITFPDDDVVSECLNPQKWIGSEKAVAADFLAPHDAFEEERRAAARDSSIGFDGRQTVAKELAIDGNDASVGGCGLEFVEGGADEHRREPTDERSAATDRRVVRVLGEGRSLGS